jgi:two-component system, sensor histidine kinase and response regulator
MDDSSAISILLVDDDEDDYLLTRELLLEADARRFALTWAATYEAALETIAQRPYDVCLVDYRLGAHTGLELIDEALARGCTAPMILLTGQGDHTIDLQAMQAGAADYLVKGQLTAPLLERSIRYALERQRTHEALRLARDAAEAASRTKGAFLANMSHEIRTPMNGILGMTALALETDLSPEQREYLTMIRNSAEALLSLLNDILDFSKIEAGKLTLDPAPFALREMVGTTLKLLALRAHQKGLELVYHAAADVPDALVGDADRLRQILINLVGNAIKFTERGEVAVWIEGARQTGAASEVHFAVADTGIGIAADKQQAILEPFTQADGSTTRQYGGTGLGLAIAKQLVELMGGRLWLESAPGRGSTFHFTVRLDCQQAAPDAPLSIDLRGLPVLVVDDNPTHRRILVEQLRHWGLRPTAVESGAAALAVLAQVTGTGCPFRLMLLDAQMPEMDGFTLAAHIQEHAGLAGATILMLSSADLPGDTGRYRQLGIARSLMKPITPAELQQALLTLLSTPDLCAEHPPLAPPRPGPDSRQRLQILLAEDNAVNQTLMARLLGKHGHQVVVVGTGREALAALAQQSFDLVLMDVQMPEMDGFEATAAIRAQERASGGHLPIIALTAHAMKGDHERCLATGMDGYMAKPIKANELYAALDQLLPSTADANAPAV